MVRVKMVDVFLGDSSSSATMARRERKKRKTPDPRHHPFVDLIFRAYKHFNKGTPCPWGDKDGRQLNDLLRVCPALDEAVFKRWLTNYFRSEVNTPDRPVYWLCKLPSYANGPLDRFRKPLRQKEQEEEIPLAQLKKERSE